MKNLTNTTPSKENYPINPEKEQLTPAEEQIYKEISSIFIAYFNQGTCPKDLAWRRTEKYLMSKYGTPVPPRKQSFGRTHQDQLKGLAKFVVNESNSPSLESIEDVFPCNT
jgi:hypothetical protein